MTFTQEMIRSKLKKPLYYLDQGSCA